jgi:hypothetical protein
MPSIYCAEHVDISQIYKGGLIFCPPSDSSRELCGFATNIVESVFENKICEIMTDASTDIALFVEKATKCKSTFTNDKKTHELLKKLILDRYKLNKNDPLLFDVPRLRIVPDSNFLSSGISYNYKPHRDTWYGAAQDQVNHWMTLANVTENSTFYIAPSYFNHPFINNSEIFDLDEWDTKHRKEAASNVSAENRPHPIPLEELDMRDRCNIVIPYGSEVVFSGHHVHGSAQNLTSNVRFSIDYRICLEKLSHEAPLNIDNRASGDYKKYMLPVS